MNKRIREGIKRGIAVLLIMCMLPFGDFVTVEAATVALKNDQAAQQEPIEGNTDRQDEKLDIEEETVSGSTKSGVPQAVQIQENMQPQVLETTGEAEQSYEDLVIEERYILGNDMCINNLEIRSGMLVLNGYKLTVYGDIYQTGGSLLVWNGILKVEGDYIQEDGEVDLRGNTVIEGDFRIQSRTVSENGTYLWGISEGNISMNNETDYLLVKGNMYESTHNGIYIGYRGKVELKGDFIQTIEELSYDSGSFYPNMIISGSEEQKIHFFETEKSEVMNLLGNLEVTNVSEGGVFIEGNVCVQGNIDSNREGHIKGEIMLSSLIKSQKGYYGGDIRICYDANLNGSIEIGGSVELGNVLYVSGKMKVDGDFRTYNDKGQIRFKEGGYVEINGECSIEHIEESIYDTPKGTLVLCGDVSIQSEAKYQGVKLILRGKGRQSVWLNNNVFFNSVVLENYSPEGVLFHSKISCNTFVDNGCYYSYFGKTVLKGDILTKDTVINEDVVFCDGELNLNGKKLIINGDLIQIGGRVNINKGDLIIHGGYYLGDPDKIWEKPLGGTSQGCLNMTNPEDYILVDEVFYMDCGESDAASQNKRLKSELSDGILEVKGDFVQKEEKRKDGNDIESRFNAVGNHTVILSGDKEQKVWMPGSAKKGSHLKNMTVTNRSRLGVFFQEECCVTGKIITDRESHISGMVSISNETQFPNHYFGGSITNCESIDIVEDIDINGI